MPLDISPQDAKQKEVKIVTDAHILQPGEKPMPVTKPGEPQVSEEQFEELKVAINKLNNQMTSLSRKIESVET